MKLIKSFFSCFLLTVCFLVTSEIVFAQGPVYSVNIVGGRTSTHIDETPNNITCADECDTYVNDEGQIFCICPVPAASSTFSIGTPTTRSYCPQGCYGCCVHLFPTGCPPPSDFHVGNASQPAYYGPCGIGCEVKKTDAGVEYCECGPYHIKDER